MAYRWSISAQALRWRANRALPSGLPRTIASLTELLLLFLLVVQCVRLFWLMVTPIGPLGEWTGRQPVSIPYEDRIALFRSFDPFHPADSAQSGPATVTSLALKLFGTRVNEASGQGSAILAGPDGVQGSYAVGEDILPGVSLKAVSFDHVTIARDGREEAIFLDQSQSVTPMSTGPALPSTLANGTAPVAPPVAFKPRMTGGAMSGLVVGSVAGKPLPSGLREGDVVTRVNGRAIAAADDIAVLQQALVPGAKVALTVEREGVALPITVTVPAL
jgi:general secretion pathway protein C